MIAERCEVKTCRNDMSALEPSLKSQVAAAMDWWRDAGVDYDYSDDATDWLAEPEPAPEAKPAPTARQPMAEPEKPAAPQIVDLLGSELPQDLAAFREFWLNDPKLALSGKAPRVSPRGEAGADLMILVATPEQEDRDQLLSGPQGRLLAKILTALELSEADVYLASCVPQFVPLADGQELVAAGYAKVLDHHIGLARPKRLLAFGSNILPLLGHDAAQQPDSVQKYAANGEDVPLLVTEGLDALANMPRLKARFWRRWLSHRAG